MISENKMLKSQLLQISKQFLEKADEIEDEMSKVTSIRSQLKGQVKELVVDKKNEVDMIDSNYKVKQ